MIISRKLFSKEKEAEDKDKKTLEILKPVAAAETIYIADKTARDNLNRKVEEKLDNARHHLLMNNDDNRLIEELKNEAKKQGTKVQTPKEFAEESKEKFLKRINKVAPGGNKDLTNKYANKIYDISYKRAASGPGYMEASDVIAMPGKNGNYYNDLENTAGTLAHELGHSKHYKGRDGGKIAKFAHRIPESTSKVASISGGFASGYKAEKDKEEGKKVSTLNKLTPGLVVAGTYAPILIAEAAASKRGIKELRKVGASEGYIRNAKKANNAALETYVVNGGLKNLSLGYGSREAGKLTRKMVRRKEAKRKDKNKDE